MKPSLISAFLTAILAGSVPLLSRGEGVVAQWEKIYNGPGNGDDVSWSIAVDSGGNVIVTGGSQSEITPSDFYTAKYAAANGALLWERRYSRGGGQRVEVDRADNVIVGGNSSGSYIAKYAAANGQLLWEKRDAISNQSVGFTDMALDELGNVIFTGYSSIGGDDIYTVKLAAANGMLVWEHRHRRPELGASIERSWGVAVDRNGNVIVTGSSGRLDGPNGRSQDFYTAKYAAATGALIWDTLSRNPPTPGVGLNVVVDGEGNAIVTGHGQNGTRAAKYAAKYAAQDGALLWEVVDNTPNGYSSGYSDVGVDSEGNAVVTGYSNNDNGDLNSYTAKYAAADGALLWEQRYNGPGDASAEVPNALLLDHAGNAIVTGRLGYNLPRGIITKKYAAEDGALLWEKRYMGAGQDQGGLDVAVDRHGSTIVTGLVMRSGSNRDYYTAKYVELDADRDGLLDSWEIAHFGGRDGQSALDDTDGDGAVELLELAFGTDPNSPSSVPAPSVVNEGGYLTTTITKQPCVRYVVETSATPAADFSAGSTTVLTDTATTLKVRDNVPIGTQPGRFLRVRVTAPP